MDPCPYGSEPKPGARPDAGLIYRSDLGIPTGPMSPAVKSFDGNSITVDAKEMVSHVTDPRYRMNLMTSNPAKEDLLGFCSSPPTLDDIAPEFDVGARNEALYRLQLSWNQNCQCSLPPQSDRCAFYQGQGQCPISYHLKVAYKVYVGSNTTPVEVVTNRDIGYFDGALGIPYQTSTNLGNGYNRIALKLDYRLPTTGVTAQISGSYLSAVNDEQYQIRDVTVTILDKIQFDKFYNVVSTNPPDNCCPPQTRPPNPNRDPYTLPNNIIFIDYDPEDNLTVLLIQGYCNPTQCTTQVGPAGDKGDKGDKGDQGATGPKGDTGDRGPTGLKGDKGDQGATGLKGDTGDRGPTGLKGDKGDQGDTGPKGDTGDRGPAGAKGDTGDRGPTGLKGDKGDPGEPQNLTASVEFLQENSTEQSSFTANKVGDTWELKLKLKMNSEDGKKILSILGGNSWNFDNAGNLTSQPSDTISTGIVPFIEHRLATTGDVISKVQGDVMKVLTNALISSVLKTVLGVEFPFTAGIVARTLFDKAIDLVDDVNSILTLINNLKALFADRGEGQGPEYQTILTLLNQIKNQAEQLDHDINDSRFNVSVTSVDADCKEKTYTTDGYGLPGIKNQLRQAMIMIADLKKHECDNECVAAVPEHYQIRPEAQRPQLVVFFAEQQSNNTLGRTRYPLTIPHYVGPNKPKLPTYRKGQWEGILTLKDNSKLIVNCFSRRESERVITAIKKYIDPRYLVDSFAKYGERKGQTLKTILVKPTSARFFPTGQKDMKPEWVAKL